MFTDDDVEIVSGRLRAWSEALASVADPEACRRFLTILDDGNGPGLRKLVERWQLPGEVGCVEVVDTITKFVHTGDYEPVETCSFPTRLKPPNPSTSSGVGYQLADGTVLWLTEKEWWDMFDHAVQDPQWRKDNHDLLVALGILFCTFEMVATIQRFDLEKKYTFCRPSWDPRAG